MKAPSNKDCEIECLRQAVSDLKEWNRHTGWILFHEPTQWLIYVDGESRPLMSPGVQAFPVYRETLPSDRTAQHPDHTEYLCKVRECFDNLNKLVDDLRLRNDVAEPMWISQQIEKCIKPVFTAVALLCIAGLLSGCYMVTRNTVFPRLTWYWSSAAKADRAEKKAEKAYYNNFTTNTATKH